MLHTHKIINVGLLAYGMSGKIFHAPFLDAHKGFNLRAVVERSKKLAKNDYPGIISYDSIDEMLNDATIDLIVVNTPNYLHYEHSKSALLKGKDILVDKPFVATSKQAQELFELADKLNRKILFYQNRRYNSDFESVIEVLNSGKLGKLVELHLRFDRYRNIIGAKAFKEKAFAASGLSYDLGSHLLDQVISLFGKPINYKKFLGKNREGTEVDDYFFVQLSYPNSLNVTVTASMLVVNPQAAYIAHGTNGSYIKQRADVQEDQLLSGMKPTAPSFGIESKEDAGILKYIDAGNDIQSSHIESPKGNYMKIFDEVYSTLTENKPYPITRDDILIQLEILES